MIRRVALILALSIVAGCSKAADTATDASATAAASASDGLASASPAASAGASPAASSSPAAGMLSPGAAASDAASAFGGGASPAATTSPESAAASSATAAASAPGAASLSGSAAELQYGKAPTTDGGVVYQPDVVIPTGGASAVRSVSSDGLTWTIDANAPHASELAVGKILFITGRGVGRVLGATRTGDDLALTLGPVEITDVVKEAHLSGENVAIDPALMTNYGAPDYPNAAVDPREIAVVRPEVRFASYQQPPVAPQEIAALQGLAGSGPPPSTDLGGYRFTAFCCGGLGVEVAHQGMTDVQILARAVLRLSAPSVDYKLDITGGKIVTAVVILNGTAGLEMHFEASTAPGVIGNANRQFYVPVDLSFPIGGVIGVPLALTVHQQFLLKTGFSAKNSSLSATGNFHFGGALNAGYQGGSWTLTAPENYTLDDKDAAVDAITGVSLGASAVEIAYEGRVIVGIGAFGFVTGPYVGFDAAYGVVRGSDTVTAMGLPTCVAAHMKTDGVAGVGYSMPKTITKGINNVLHALNIAPIQGFGGLKYAKTFKTFHTSRPSGCA